MMFRRCVVFLFSSIICTAQSREPRDAWLMQNFRFAKPPVPGEVHQVSPTVSQLQEIHNTTLSILRKANFAGDFEAALAAAAQAVANARLLESVTGEPDAQPTGELKRQKQIKSAVAEERKTEPPIYLIAFTDKTIQAATAVWTDRLMLHYITRQGGHEQVRLDRVDWKSSAELNWQSGQSP